MSLQHFASEIFTKVDAYLANFATLKSAAIAAVINPSVGAILGISWVIFGVNHMMGQAEEPFMAFVHRTFKQAIILGVAFNATTYNDWIIQTFQDSPVALAAAMSSDPNNPTTLSGTAAMWDNMLDNMNATSGKLFDLATFTRWSPAILGALVFLVGYVVAIAAIALVMLSKTATALLLGIGPLFVYSLLFDTTRNYFGGWINNLVNFGLVGVFAVSVQGLIVSMFAGLLQGSAQLQDGATIIEVGGIVLTGGFALYCLWNVPALASSLSNGLHLATFGHGRATAKTAGRFTGRGIMQAGRMTAKATKYAANKMRGNEVRVGERTVRKAPRQEVIRWRKRG